MPRVFMISGANGAGKTTTAMALMPDLLECEEYPDVFVERRYKSGLENFFRLYIPIADTWLLYDNSSRNPVLIAQKETDQSVKIFDGQLWQKIRETTK